MLFIFELFKYVCLLPIAKILCKKRDIFLFAERGTDARDNGFYMYRYFRQNHPELESYYVITKDSPDRYKVEELGNVVNRGSLKHYLLFITAKYKISTHIMGYSPNIGFYSRFADRLHLKGHRIFLQHGVTKDNLKALYKNKTNLDRFICGAKPEYDYVSKTFGYEDGEVKYTGFARYDGLHNIVLKKQILCMPTWRMYLNGVTINELEKSEYVEKWNAIINDNRLISTLKNNGLKLIFYPHYELQKHLSLFKSESDEVVIASFKDYDVQTLLKESRLLITDYSSVYFDFAYMKKPVVYYQFDKEQFESGHYAKGYFDYETMGFGEVVEDKEDVIDAILKYIENGFDMGKYEKRTEEFFPLHDKNNCKRIYEYIMEKK